jgi:hypothetical protein
LTPFWEYCGSRASALDRETQEGKQSFLVEERRAKWIWEVCITPPR